MDKELTELIKSIRNRCDIYILITNISSLSHEERADVEHLLPTLLEDLFTDAQEIIDNYCIKHD